MDPQGGSVGTTFLFSTLDYESALIEDITSRCIVFSMDKISKEDIYGRISYVGGEIGQILDPQKFDNIWDRSTRDLRNCLDLLVLEDFVVTKPSVERIIASCN